MNFRINASVTKSGNSCERIPAGAGNLGNGLKLLKKPLIASYVFKTPIARVSEPKPNIAPIEHVHVGGSGLPFPSRMASGEKIFKGYF